MNHRTLTALAAAALLAASCAEEGPSTDQNDSGAHPTAAPGASGVRDSATGFEPIDPATGTMKLEATGEHAGTWTFKDVNGSITERAGGGQTTLQLQLEAHDEPVHFKIRMNSSAGEFQPGQYTIGGSTNIDATFEHTKVFYKAFGASSGAVSLTSISDDRAKGSFDLTLETLEEKPRVARVTGTFDMRVQR